MSRLRRPRVWIAALLASALIVGCATSMRAPTSQPSPHAAELLRDYRRAERFRADGKLVESHEVFLDLRRRLAQSDVRPARPVTRKNLARNVRRIEKEIKESSREAFQRLVIIQQHYERAAQIEFEKGLAAYTEGRFDEARKTFSQALDFNPDHPEAARRLAETRQRIGLGHPEMKAIADQIQLETVRRQQEEIRLRNLIAAGQEARQRKDFDAAKAFFQQALIRLTIQDSLPRDTGAAYEKKARRALDTSKNEDLHSKATYSLLRNLMAAGKKARGRKDYDAARGAFEQALVRLEIDDSLPCDVAAEMEENVRDQLAQTDTEKPESDRQIRERKDIRKKELQKLKERSWALINDDKYDEAVEILNRVLDKDPRDPEANWLRDRFRLRKRWKMEEGFDEDGGGPRPKILVDKEEKLIPYYKILRYPSNWEQKEGKGAVRELTGLGLLFSGGYLTQQDGSVLHSSKHRRVSKALKSDEELWVIAKPDSEEGRGPGALVTGGAADELREILQKLRTKISFDFQDAPITDVKKILESCGLNIVLDVQNIELTWGALEDVTVTLKLNEITAENALHLICRLTQLRWTLQSGVLLITTDEGEGLLQSERRVYHVDEFPKQMTAQSIAQSIETGVMPEVWQEDENSILTVGDMLIVTAPFEVHCLVLQCLDDWRAGRNLNITEDWNPGSGALMTTVPGEARRVPVPLKHTDVKGRVTGYIAAVDVTQKFHNPFNEKIEAEYVFPLPQNAAVNEFLMTIGDRRIRGIIREREEAETIYREARARGHVASLLTQQRPNVFTQKVANIEPGKTIDISITYFNTLDYRDGWYEFVFPMVVGPRFNPPGQTDGVGAVARGKRGSSGQKTEVQYLAPDERSGHDIALSVEIDAGVAIEDVVCVNHVVRKTTADDTKMTVEIAALDSIPNKDFVLRYKVAGARIKTALFTHQDERGGFFTLMLFPPEDLKSLKRAPMEMVFVLDCSGSMSGRPIEQAKNAIRRALRSLQPGDTFQIIRFSNNASQLGPAPIEATPENVENGLAYVDSLNGGGGTMMIEGIKAALDFPHDQERLRVVAFLTDGYIGNESEILGEVNKRLGASRIFSFGVGNSVNRYLLQRMAGLGRGTAAFVSLQEDAGKVMDRYFERTSHPAMCDIEIDWGNLIAADIFPAAVPDLFAGAPVIVTGRFTGEVDSPVKLSGKIAGKTRTFTLPVNSADPARHKGLAYVWARTKIAGLMDRATHEGPDKLVPEIKQLALNYGLMSQYTSFIAVDSMTRTHGDHGATVAVPVPVAQGVRYETTVID